MASAQTELETKTANYHKATAMLKTYMGVEVSRRGDMRRVNSNTANVLCYLGDFVVDDVSEMDCVLLQ